MPGKTKPAFHPCPSQVQVGDFPAWELKGFLGLMSNLLIWITQQKKMEYENQYAKLQQQFAELSAKLSWYEEQFSP